MKVYSDNAVSWNATSCPRCQPGTAPDFLMREMPDARVIRLFVHLHAELSCADKGSARRVGGGSSGRINSAESRAESWHASLCGHVSLIRFDTSTIQRCAQSVGNCTLQVRAEYLPGNSISSRGAHWRIMCSFHFIVFHSEFRGCPATTSGVQAEHF
jgi:hypothetical protein